MGNTPNGTAANDTAVPPPPTGASKTGLVFAWCPQTRAILYPDGDGKVAQGVPDVIRTHLASPASLGSHEPADFILAFWMLHEVPDQGAFLSGIRTLIKPEGMFLLAEPKLHVPRKSFLRSLKTAQGTGWVVREEPPVRMSHSALLVPRESGR